MKRVKYQLYDDNITLEILYTVRDYMTIEERAALDKKMDVVLGTQTFESFGSRALADKAFRLGYLAAHTRYNYEGEDE